jgi:hypothetical protein
MARFELAVQDLAWTRFGISPLAEATRSLLAVPDPRPRRSARPEISAITDAPIG